MKRRGRSGRCSLKLTGHPANWPPTRRPPGLPTSTGRLFDPGQFLPSEYMYKYVPGYSKRTLLGGFLPAADIGGVESPL